VLREHRALFVLVVTVATLLVLAIVILPPLLAGGDDTENDVRSTLLQGLAGLFLAGGLYFTAQTLRLNRESAERTSKSAERTYRLEREGQITERFTRAIDQLGNKELDVRLGGIYALEGIARDSEKYHGPIMEVLTAYVREHAPCPPRSADKGEEAVSDEHREPDEDGVPAPATDVQAVIAVLGRRVLGRKGEHDLDLRLVDLRRAKFGKGADEGHFERANFAGAQLERADLDLAHLTGANLEHADLTEAILTRADLTGAHLEEATLTEADLAEATLTGAHLEGATLTKAILFEATLTGAILVGANLTGADLTGTDLTEATLFEASLTDSVYDSETRWPDGFDPKAEGARLSEEDSELPSAG
jgi:Pentapeptide repeats (8 copies)